ncbi:unnamed protein product, partial [Scytosiphon promiscuus]
MKPAAEDKETREGETKQEERKEDEGNTRCNDDPAPVASMTPTSTASVALAEGLPATTQSESSPQTCRTCSLKVAYVNMSTAAAAPASVIRGHGDALSVKRSDGVFNRKAEARDASVVKPSVDTGSATKKEGTVIGVGGGTSGSVRSKVGTGAGEQGLKEEEKQELEEGEIRPQDIPAAGVSERSTSTAAAGPTAATPVAALGNGNHGHVDIGMGLSGGTPVVPVAGAAAAAKSEGVVAGGGSGNSGSG